MQLSSLIQQLTANAKKPLPGHQSFLANMKPPRNHLPTPRLTPRSSAVLIVFYPKAGEAYFPLIKRPPYDGTHGGQVAFPGGQAEPEDESLERTALRETQEEIGIKAMDVNVITSLSKIYIPPSNFWVTPFVGFLDYRPDFFPDAREVEKVIEVSFTNLLENFRPEERKIPVRGSLIPTTGFWIEGQWVWGATALILYELLEMYRRS